MKNSDEKLIPLLEISSHKESLNNNTETELKQAIPMATTFQQEQELANSNGYQQDVDEKIKRQNEGNDSNNNDNNNDNNNSPQSKFVKNSPHYLITYFFDQLYDFEFQMKPRAWVYHIIICVCAITLLSALRQGVCPDIPMIQILFVALLINFGVNYYILRLGNILPYIEDNSQNQLAKFIGLSGLALIILAILSSTYQDLFNIFFFSSWILAMSVEIVYYKFTINWKELLFLLLILVGTFLITLKNLFAEGELLKFSVLSIIGGIAASVLLTFFTLGLKQINKTNFLTTIHIVLLMILIFLPIFFPFANIVPPTLWNWCFFVLASIMTYLILVLFIRSIQLQNPSKILLFLNLIFVAQIVLELIQNKSTFSGIQYLGCVFIAIACLAISFVGENPDGMKEGQSFYFSKNPATLNSNEFEMETIKN